MKRPLGPGLWSHVTEGKLGECQPPTQPRTFFCVLLRFLVSEFPITYTLQLKVIYSCSYPGKVLLTVLVRFQLCLWLHLGKCTDSQSYCQILTRYEAFRRRCNQSTTLSTPEIALLLIQLFKVSILASAECNVFNFKPEFSFIKRMLEN